MITKRKFNHPFVALAMLVLASLACTLFANDNVGVDNPVQPQPTATASSSQSNQTGEPTLSRADLIAGTVQIKAAFKKNNEYQVAWTGSGTIISPSGLILTNSHVAAPSAMDPNETDPDLLAIGLVESEDKPPVFSYIAEVRAVDGYLDLAVLQIVSTLDGSAVDASQLNLPYVPLGDSDKIHVGDHLSIFGFPGIGGETITFTDGSVSGFTSEDQVGDRAWVKTDATIAGGNSGGLAADDAGHIIGVPSRASSGSDSSQVTDCRVVQDTNDDGVIDDKDTCIPIGGFINAIRPIKLALALIKASRDGQNYASPYGSTGSVANTGGSGQEQFGPVSWYTIDSDGKPVDRVDSYPTGTGTIAANFEFSGMTDGQSWAEAWYNNGEQVAAQKFNWEYGTDGNLTVYLYNNDGSELADGDYKLELYAGTDLPKLTEGEVTLGGSAANGSISPSPVTSDKGVQLLGTISDQDTNKPIKDALFIVLKPGISVSKWQDNNLDESMIFASAKTDRKGYFELPDRLQRDTKYTIVIVAEGYQAQVFENEVLDDSTPDNFELSIPLTRQ
jgi:serine protease Do